ncbi:hypothetical protein ACGFZC_16335 [[Kitasatospora] papulosa]|uniref:hypothetical protein n=1 Tax=[Kitasatospora] papulosa TaxID=1464011 RepID=UPI0037145FFD
MLQTIKTYSSQDGKTGFIFSYAEEAGADAKLTLFRANEDPLTVDFTSEDVKALNEVVSNAYYATMPTSL